MKSFVIEERWFISFWTFDGYMLTIHSTYTIKELPFVVNISLDISSQSCLDWGNFKYSSFSMLNIVSATSGINFDIVLPHTRCWYIKLWYDSPVARNRKVRATFSSGEIVNLKCVVFFLKHGVTFSSSSFGNKKKLNATSPFFLKQ